MMQHSVARAASTSSRQGLAKQPLGRQHVMLLPGALMGWHAPLRRQLAPLCVVGGPAPGSRGGGSSHSGSSSSAGPPSSKAKQAAQQLEVLRQEAAATKKLKMELDARTAATANLQAQLKALEELRAAELEAAAERFAEFEEALSVAEKSIDELGDEGAEKVLALEAKLAKAESELASTRQEVELLRRQPQQQGGQGAAVVAAGPAQQRQQAAEAALRAALKQKEGETAALRTQVELLQRQLAVAASAGKGPGAAAATAAAGSSGGGALDEVRQLRAEVASLRESEQQKIADLQEAADVAQMLADQIEGLTQELEANQASLAHWQREAEAAEQAAEEADAERRASLEEVDRLQDLLAEREQDVEATVSVQANLGEQLQLLHEQASLLRQRLADEMAAAAAASQRAAAAEEKAAEVVAQSRGLRDAAAAEAAAAEDLLARAEVAAEQAGQQLLELMSLRQEVKAQQAAWSAEEEEREEEEEETEGEGGGLLLSEADVDAVLDELEVMRAELAKEVQTSGTLTSRLEAAQQEAAQLRSHLEELSSAPAAANGSRHGAGLERGPSGTVGVPAPPGLSKLVAEAEQAAAVAEAEAEALAVENEALHDEVARLRAELGETAARAASAAQAAPPPPVASLLPGAWHQQQQQQQQELAALLARAAALEQENAELRGVGAQREAILAQSRKFIESYLQRAAAAADAAAAMTAGSEEGPEGEEAEEGEEDVGEVEEESEEEERASLEEEEEGPEESGVEAPGSEAEAVRAL